MDLVKKGAGRYETQDGKFRIEKRNSSWQIIYLSKGFRPDQKVWLTYANKYPSLKKAREAVDLWSRERPRPAAIRPLHKIQNSYRQSACGQFQFARNSQTGNWYVHCLMTDLRDHKQMWEAYLVRHGIELPAPKINEIIKRFETAFEIDPPHKLIDYPE